MTTYKTALLLTIACLSSGAYANDTTPSSLKDAMILNQIHHINQKEIRGSQMALKRSEKPEIKSFAQKMERTPSRRR